MYRGRRYSRKRYSRRRSNYNRRAIAPSYGQIGSKLWKDVMWLKSVINVETKENTVTSSSLTPDNTGEFALLTGIAEGDDSTNRNGRSIKASSIYFIGRFTINASASSTTCRVMIFIDKVSNGIVPDESELLANAGLMAPLNQDNAGSRFIVLYDKYIDLTLNGQETITVKFYKKLNHHVKFEGTTGVQSSCTSGHLYMYLKSNETVNLPALNYTTRFMFIDN